MLALSQPQPSQPSRPSTAAGGEKRESREQRVAAVEPTVHHFLSPCEALSIQYELPGDRTIQPLSEPGDRRISPSRPLRVTRRFCRCWQAGFLSSWGFHGSFVSASGL